MHLSTICAVALCVFLVASSSRAADDLADGFRNVPGDARLRMYWRLFGPAWTKPEIDYELEVLKKAGVGGVTLYFMYPFALDDPAHGIVNQRFGSPEFLDTFGYAARKAKDLGLSFGLNGSTGWPYGGPSVKGQDAAQRLWHKRIATLKDLKLKEGEAVLAAYQGGMDVTKELLARMRSVALGSTAVGDAGRPWQPKNPAPTGRLTQSPGQRPGLGTPNPQSPVGVAREPSGTPQATTPIDLYLTGPTGMWVKRAAFGAEGPVLNHYDTPALMRYLTQVIEPIIKSAPGCVEALGCDSLEVYDSNWVQDLPREFKKRRGYDLIPHLRQLFDESASDGKAVRFDFWRTLGELTEERFTRPLGAWCKKRGMNLEMEAYGTPPNPMTSYRFIQVPTGEHYEWKGFSVQKFVASAADLTKKPIVGSEAWTWAGLPNRLADTLSDIKLVSDMAFVAGANDLTGVDYPYSPRSEGSPGWQPYYGPTFNQNNPLWAFFPALAEYLSRCQWMLRQGKPIRNVAVYLPVEDAFAEGPPEMMLLDFLVRDRFVTGKATSEFGMQNALKHHSDLLHGLISHGYDYDGIDFWAMNRLAEVRGDKLAAGDARFGAVVLPNLRTMDLDAARKVAAFCEAGGTVVVSRRVPRLVPGLRPDSESQELQACMDRLVGEHPKAGEVRRVGSGHAVFVAEDKDVASAMPALIEPDVRYASEQKTVGYVHRRIKQGDVYFFLNVGPETVSFSPRFPGRKRRTELWDPLTGGIAMSDSGGPLTLDLPPRGSIFVVLGRTTAAAGKQKHTSPYRTLELAPSWHVTFDGPDAPPPLDVATLRSWTELAGGKYFSGLATYTADVQIDEDLPTRAVLKFDDVRDAAEVKVNGRSMGVVFTRPWEVDVAPALKKGSNSLQVTVANLLVNRFIGLPDLDIKALRAKYGSRFQAPEEKEIMKGVPAPSGLIGGVRLILER